MKTSTKETETVVNQQAQILNNVETRKIKIKIPSLDFKTSTSKPSLHPQTPRERALYTVDWFLNGKPSNSLHFNDQACTTA